MSLTLRPTGLSDDSNRNDWNVHADGGDQPIGRIYEFDAAPSADVRWFWAIQSPGRPPRWHRHVGQRPDPRHGQGGVPAQLGGVRSLEGQAAAGRVIENPNENGRSGQGKHYPEVDHCCHE
jgi:hypothetical protein